ncbi:cache domain-containing protein [Vagococcus sp.]|uniref:cache domain-containing protein n=1 Tax=Vagococcus sp. TaxID=1933889 RepID=UPI003F9B8F15
MLKKYQIFYHRNELFIKIFAIAFSAILFVAFTIGFVAIKTAEKAYISSYKESNQLLLNKVSHDYEALNDNIINVFQSLNFNPAMKHFLKDNLSSEIDHNVAIFQMKDELKNTRLLYNEIASHLIVVGTNGKIHYQGQGGLLYRPEEFLDKKYIKLAKSFPQSTHYFSKQHGYSDITKDKANLTITKALYDQEGVYGFAIMMILEEEFSQFYTRLVDPNINRVWIADTQGTIISSNHKTDIGKKNETFLSKDEKKAFRVKQSLTKQPVYSFNYTLYNLINDELVAKKNDFTSNRFLGRSFFNYFSFHHHLLGD